MAVVGVTGHRVLADPQKIHEAVGQSLHRIQKRYPDQSLRLLTQLADGSDRIVAEHFFKNPRWRVAAVLPMPLAEYLNDFSEDSRKIVLDMLQQCEETFLISTTGNR